MTEPGPFELIHRAGTPMSWSTNDYDALRARLGLVGVEDADRILTSALRRQPIRYNPDAPGLLVAHYMTNVAVILENDHHKVTDE